MINIYHYAFCTGIKELDTTRFQEHSWTSDGGITPRSFVYDIPEEREKFFRNAIEYTGNIDENKIYDIASNIIPKQYYEDDWYEMMIEKGYIGFRNTNMYDIYAHVIVLFENILIKEVK